MLRSHLERFARGEVDEPLETLRGLRSFLASLLGPEGAQVSIEQSERVPSRWLHRESESFSVGSVLLSHLQDGSRALALPETMSLATWVLDESMFGKGRQIWINAGLELGSEEVSARLPALFESPELRGHAVAAARAYRDPGLVSLVRVTTFETEQTWVREEVEKYLSDWG